MGAFVLGSIDPLSVREFSGFDLPDDIQVVTLLADDDSTHNEVLQQGSSRMPRASLKGRAEAYATIASLRGYRQTHEVLAFTEPDAGVHQVVVLDFDAKRQSGSLFLWEWTATLIETEPQA